MSSEYLDRTRIEATLANLEEAPTEEIIAVAAVVREDASFLYDAAGKCEAELRRRAKAAGVTSFAEPSYRFAANLQTPQRTYIWHPEILEREVRPLLTEAEWDAHVQIKPNLLRIAREALDGLLPTATDALIAIDQLREAGVIEEGDDTEAVMWRNVVYAAGLLDQLPPQHDTYVVSTVKLLNLGKARGGALAWAIALAHTVEEKDPKISYQRRDS